MPEIWEGKVREMPIQASPCSLVSHIREPLSKINNNKDSINDCATPLGKQLSGEDMDSISSIEKRIILLDYCMARVL